MVREQIKPSILMFLFLTLVTGVMYPLLVTSASHIFFKKQAAGSLIYLNGKAVGSELIGQSFSDPKYFWGRPSATAPDAYNGGASTGSNLGPLNPEFLKKVESRAEELRNADPSNPAKVPVDLVTSSASGLDPHISLAAAFYQLPRIVRLRRLPEEEVKKLIFKNKQPRFLGVSGEPAVNVLKLNLDLDKLKS